MLTQAPGGLMKRVGAVSFWTAILAAAALAEEPPPTRVPPDLSEDGPVLIAHMKGDPIRNGTQMWYQIDAGPIATRAVRVYSEPSHTRIAMAVDSSFGTSDEGKTWLASIADVKQDVNLSLGPLPGSHPRFRQRAMPATDTWIAMWVYGDFNGVIEDRLVDQLVVDHSRSFGDSASLRSPAETEGGAHPDIETCCDCHNDTSSCKDCTGFHNCCYYKDPCEIHWPAEICGPA